MPNGISGRKTDGLGLFWLFTGFNEFSVMLNVLRFIDIGKLHVMLLQNFLKLKTKYSS